MQSIDDSSWSWDLGESWDLQVGLGLDERTSTRKSQPDRQPTLGSSRAHAHAYAALDAMIVTMQGSLLTTSHF